MTPALRLSLAGGGTLVLALLMFAFDAGQLRTRFDQLAMDWLLPVDNSLATSPTIRVVDIDRESLEAIGPWPWPREVQARLLEAIIASGPQAVGADIAYLEQDRSSPAALARMLGAQTGKAEISDLSSSLPDGDLMLADAMAKVPMVAGLLVEPDGKGDALPPMVLSTTRERMAIEPWRVAALRGPSEPLLSAATGTGVLSLPGDSDGIVRSAPLIVLAPGGVYSGFSLEMLRMAAQVGDAELNSEDNTLTLGNFSIKLGRGAEALLRPSPRRLWAERTVKAHEVLSNKIDFRNQIVLIGGSAPELGALRATAADAATPSVQIHADLLRQLLVGDLPRRTELGSAQSLLLAGLAGLLAIAIALRWSPVAGVSLVLAFCGAYVFTVWRVFEGLNLILPLWPVIFVALPFLVSALVRFVATYAQERAMRARFAQRLPPDIVDRIAADPSVLKLEGSNREITVLFTDIEGFTALTERLEARQVIALLDRYMDVVGAIIVKHGGMIDKFVGDAVHAIFNAPLDLHDHATKAIHCAVEILAATKALQSETEITGHGLGRTRIGIETGPAVVGDVGQKGRLDYTAHGSVINTAARLEAANKQLGSSICIGPIAAKSQNGLQLLPLGTVELQGLNPLQVFTVS